MLKKPPWKNNSVAPLRANVNFSLTAEINTFNLLQPPPLQEIFFNTLPANLTVVS